MRNPNTRQIQCDLCGQIYEPEDTVFYGFYSHASQKLYSPIITTSFFARSGGMINIDYCRAHYISHFLQFPKKILKSIHTDKQLAYEARELMNKVYGEKEMSNKGE